MKLRSSVGTVLVALVGSAPEVGPCREEVMTDQCRGSEPLALLPDVLHHADDTLPESNFFLFLTVLLILPGASCSSRRDRPAPP